MTTLPATLQEAEAREFARAEIAWFRDHPVCLFGINVRMLDEGDNRHFARQAMKAQALAHPLNMMKIVDYARAGWTLADDALCELIIEFEHRGERKPPPLANYTMERARDRFRHVAGRGKEDNFLRDVALMTVAWELMKKFGLKPTRTTRKRPSVCSILAQVVPLSEPTITTLWQRLGRHL